VIAITESVRCHSPVRAVSVRVDQPVLSKQNPLDVEMRNAKPNTESVAMVQTMREMTDMRRMHALVSRIGIRGHCLAMRIRASTVV
jgi:hypothetical protein